MANQLDWSNRFYSQKHPPPPFLTVMEVGRLQMKDIAGSVNEGKPFRLLCVIALRKHIFFYRIRMYEVVCFRKEAFSGPL